MILAIINIIKDKGKCRSKVKYIRSYVYENWVSVFSKHKCKKKYIHK